MQREFQWWRKGKCYRTSWEVEFGITSLTRAEAPPEQLLKIRRAHWGIETGLHYRRDVTLKEDTTRMIIGNTAKIMAGFNTLVLALVRQASFHNVAQARCWFSAHIPRLLLFLLPLFPDFAKAMVK